MKHIVYIHGFNCSSKIFNHLHSQLPKHKATFVEYNTIRPIEDSVTTAFEESPEEPFYIIGHSLGGIVGFLLATHSNLNVEGIVSISTPFGGSDVAGKLKWFYPGIKVFKDLSPGSDIIRSLPKLKLPCPFLSIVSIAGGLTMLAEENDGVVTVESQRAVSATRRVDVNSNHFEAVQDQTTIEEVKKFIFSK